MSDNLTLDKALERIEEIADIMDKGDLPFDELMEYYEEAFKLFEFCYTRLNKYNMRIVEIEKRMKELEESGESFEE